MISRYTSKKSLLSIEQALITKSKKSEMPIQWFPVKLSREYRRKSRPSAPIPRAAVLIPLRRL